MTPSGADRLLGDVDDIGALHRVIFEWADGVVADKADSALKASGFAVLTNRDALKPGSVTSLGHVAPNRCELRSGMGCSTTPPVGPVGSVSALVGILCGRVARAESMSDCIR